MSGLIGTKDAFNTLTAARPVAILFYSAWCPFCTDFLPVFEKYAGAAPDSFRRVLTDELPDLEDKYSVDVVPTVIFFKDGKVSKRLDGVLGAGLDGSGLAAFLKACGLTG